MMFTRAQVRKPKSRGHNSNQKAQSQSSYKNHNLQQQQQYEWDVKYFDAAAKPAFENYKRSSLFLQTYYKQSPPRRNGRVHDWDRNRCWDKDRDRDRDRNREHYSDRSNFSSHKSHSYELPHQHSKEKSYAQFYEHEMDHSIVGDYTARRTRPRSITNRRGAIKQHKLDRIISCSTFVPII